MTLKQRFIDWCNSRCDRGPDKVILRTDGSMYLRRWHVIERNRWLNIYQHDFQASDDERAEHDHPWLFNISILVQGNYWEISLGKLSLRHQGEWKFRLGKSRHRVKLQRFGGKEIPCKTIFITGPIIRGSLTNPTWGFYCPKGWVHWKIFTSFDGKTATISRGCE